MSDLSAVARIRLLAVSGDARRIRVAARVGLSELAGEIAVSPMTLSRWERGIGSPTLNNAESWCAALDALSDVVLEARPDNDRQ